MPRLPRVAMSFPFLSGVPHFRLPGSTVVPVIAFRGFLRLVP
ncbi:hypothetical protein QFZ61_000859 [Arthrobacter sp. B3I4]|nr:hypothetical protein [Arthrobacter sp. B3I4]